MDNAHRKYCWLNLTTGEFSNSWDRSVHIQEDDFWDAKFLQDTKRDGWKLIEFNCLNDEDFTFTEHMKLK